MGMVIYRPIHCVVRPVIGNYHRDIGTIHVLVEVVSVLSRNGLWVDLNGKWEW